MSIMSSVIFFPCFNINETAEFYLDVIGLKLHSDQGNCKIFDTGYGYIGFCQYSKRTTIASGPCISLNCIDVDDVDKHYKILKNKDCEIVSPPKHHDDFPVYSFFLKDPNGYTLEFQKILN